MISRRKLIGSITIATSILVSGCFHGKQDTEFLIQALSIELDDERESMVYAVTVDISYSGDDEETQDVVLHIDDEEYDRNDVTISGRANNYSTIEVVIFEIAGHELESGTYKVTVKTDDDERKEDLVIPSG